MSEPSPEAREAASPESPPPSARVAIVGGGLAGLAAAVALAGRGLAVQLFEARRQLGGRAASFTDAASGELIDYCQHISLGCCTNLADFCRRTGTADLFRRDGALDLFTRDGRMSRLKAVPLPAPLHLAPALLRLHFLSSRERFGIARAMLKLTRANPEELAGQTVAAWLARHGQSQRRDRSILGRRAHQRAWANRVERREHAARPKGLRRRLSLLAQGYELWVPRVSLTELYAERLAPWFAEHGVELHMESSVREIDVLPHRVSIAVDRTTHECGAVVVAVPWTRVRQILAPRLVDALPELAGLDQIDAAPITGVHLWFDREITPLPHAALVDMLSQWLFRRGTSAETDGSGAYYYQVVISASRHIAGRDRGDVVTEICASFATFFRRRESKTAALEDRHRFGRCVFRAAGNRGAAARPGDCASSGFIWPAIGRAPAGPRRWKAPFAAATWLPKACFGTSAESNACLSPICLARGCATDAALKLSVDGQQTRQ